MSQSALPASGDEISVGELKRRTLGGFAWISAATAIRAVLRLVVLMALGRLLLPREFGLVAAAGVIIWFGNILSGLGVGPALVQRPRLETRHVHTAVTASILLGVMLSLLAVWLAPAIAAAFRMPELTAVLRVMAIVLPIAALSVVGECLLQRELRFGEIARYELVSYAVGYGLIGISVASLGGGVWSLVAADLAKTTIKSVLFIRASPHSKRPGFDPAAFRELARFGSGYTVTSLSMYFALQGDNLVIARALGASALGLYGRAYELMGVPAKAIGDVVHKILFPAMSRVQHDATRLALAYRRGMAAVALLVLPFSGVTVVLAPEIVRTLLGGNWDGVITPLRILTFAMYPQVGYMIGQSVTHAGGAVYRTAWRSGAYALLVVAGALVGQRWGVAGVAAAVALAITANFLLIAHLAGRVSGLKLRAFILLHGPAFAFTVAAVLTAWLAASALRGLGAPSPLVLVAVAVAVLTVCLAVLRLAPRVVLGHDGGWLLRTITENLPERFRAPIRWTLGDG